MNAGLSSRASPSVGADGSEFPEYSGSPQNPCNCRGFVIMQYWVYILQSLKDGSFYIGYTHDLEARVKEHNEGSTRYTKQKRPWELVYQEEFISKSEAIKRELFLKRQRNTDFYKKLINNG